MYVKGITPRGYSDQFIDDELSKIELEFRAINTPEDWHEIGDTNEPAFENSWANVTGWDTAGFYKHFDVVYLKGAIDTGTNNVTAFTLPDGYRPSAKKALQVNQIGISTNTGYLTIDTDGTVTPTTGSSQGITLEGLSFRI